MKHLILSVLLTVLGSTAFANEIYINQIGDTLDLDIVQDGQDNTIGAATSGDEMTLSGDDMTFSITQTGNNNSIAATIKGATYTGTWSFTGDNNDVDLLCSSAGAANCDTVTLNITTTGSDNTFDFDIGETSAADSSTVSFTVEGDNNVIKSAIDGQSAALTVVMDNSASIATGGAANSDSSLTSTAEGNVLDITMSGDGDSAGHTINLDITGGASSFEIDQSEIYDNTVDATFNGDGLDVDITQSD